MKQSEIYGLIGSILTCVLIFLLLWFLYMNVEVPEEEEGIMVSIGNADAGGGWQESQMSESTPVAPPPTPTMPSQNDLMTQEDESLALAEQRKQEARKKAAEEAERIRKQKEEEARIAAEKAAREAALAEQRRQEQEKIDKANKLGGLFGNNTSGNGSGNTTGNQYEGNPLGKGTSGGNSYSVNGRYPKRKGDIVLPSDNSNIEGTVIVTIRVNATGRVISANVTGGNISTPQVREAARQAALKTVFSEGKDEVTGIITFNFKLN